MRSRSPAQGAATTQGFSGEIAGKTAGHGLGSTPCERSCEPSLPPPAAARGEATGDSPRFQRSPKWTQVRDGFVRGQRRGPERADCRAGASGLSVQISTKKLPSRVFTRDGSRRNFCSSCASWSRATEATRATGNVGLPGDNGRMDVAARRCGGLRQRQARRLAVIGAALRYSHNASLNHLLYYEEPELPQPLRGHRPDEPSPSRRQEH